MDPLVATWNVKVVARELTVEALGTPAPRPVPFHEPTNAELEAAIVVAVDLRFGLAATVTAERTDK
jgi:hypothetical protein